MSGLSPSYQLRLKERSEFVGAVEGVKFVAALARLPTQILRDLALNGWIMLEEEPGLVVGTEDEDVLVFC